MRVLESCDKHTARTGAMALRAASRRLASQLRAAQVSVLGGERLIQHNSGKDQQQAHPKPTPLPKLKDSFLDGTSSTYLEELEERYRSDPSSVDKTWASFFGSLGAFVKRSMDAIRLCLVLLGPAKLVQDQLLFVR